MKYFWNHTSHYRNQVGQVRGHAEVSSDRPLVDFQVSFVSDESPEGLLNAKPPFVSATK